MDSRPLFGYHLELQQLFDDSTLLRTLFLLDDERNYKDEDDNDLEQSHESGDNKDGDDNENHP